MGTGRWELVTHLRVHRGHRVFPQHTLNKHTHEGDSITSTKAGLLRRGASGCTRATSSSASELLLALRSIVPPTPAPAPSCSCGPALRAARSSPLHGACLLPVRPASGEVAASLAAGAGRCLSCGEKWPGWCRTWPKRPTLVEPLTANRGVQYSQLSAMEQGLISGVHRTVSYLLDVCWAVARHGRWLMMTGIRGHCSSVGRSLRRGSVLVLHEGPRRRRFIVCAGHWTAGRLSSPSTHDHQCHVGAWLSYCCISPGRSCS